MMIYRIVYIIYYTYMIGIIIIHTDMCDGQTNGHGHWTHKWHNVLTDARDSHSQRNIFDGKSFSSELN